MRLLHISDLHLGKRVNEFSMLEDQKYILSRIIGIVDEEKPDGIIIAGDVYDKAIPGEEAVRLLDEFLTKLAKRHLAVYIINGNHDSAVKLAFASELISSSGVHIAPLYNGEIKPLKLESENASVNLYLLPFLKPITVRALFPEEDIQDYTDAVRVAISKMHLNKQECNILVAHQFVTGAVTSDSEERTVGGLDNVDSSVFEDFDYVALGHIHGPQKIGKETVRYSGTPLKYSFSEVNHKKSVTVLDIDPTEKKVEIRTVDLVPLRDMREIRGSFAELTSKEYYENTNTNDYLQITLTDEEDILDAMARLRLIYPYTMALKYDNKRTRENRMLTRLADVENKSPLELFDEFYETQNNQPLSECQKEFISQLISSIWEGKA